MEKVSISGALSSFSDPWAPRIVASMNDAEIKVAKLQGDFVWHHHDDTDELFLVVEGELTMRYREHGRDGELLLRPGELVVVPAKLEHCPSAPGGCSVVLFERRGTLNTGNAGGALTNEARHL